MSNIYQTPIELSISAENTFTPAFKVGGAIPRASLSISGTFVATVTVQRRLDGVNWRDVDPEFTTEDEKTYESDEVGEIRMGIKTGNYTSGAALCRIG